MCFYAIFDLLGITGNRGRPRLEVCPCLPVHLLVCVLLCRRLQCTVAMVMSTRSWQWEIADSQSTIVVLPSLCTLAVMLASELWRCTNQVPCPLYCRHEMNRSLSTTCTQDKFTRSLNINKKTTNKKVDDANN